MNILVILDQSRSMSVYKNDVQNIYKQIENVEDVTTIGFSFVENLRLFNVYKGLPNPLYHTGSGRPGHSFLLPMLNHLQNKECRRVVIFITGGIFDETKFNDTFNQLPGEFPQFFPILISCGQINAIIPLMKTMFRFSYGRMGFHNVNTKTLASTIQTFKNERLIPSGNMLYPETELMVDDFPMSLKSNCDNIVITEYIKIISLIKDGKKISNILNELLRSPIDVYRNRLIALIQTTSLVDVNNSERIIDIMEEKIDFVVDEDHLSTNDILVWRDYPGLPNICYRIIGYKTTECGKPITCIWNYNKLMFYTNQAEIFYTIEIIAKNRKPEGPVILSTYDANTGVYRHYILLNGQGIIDGGQNSRMVFRDISELTFQIAYEKDLKLCNVNGAINQHCLLSSNFKVPKIFVPRPKIGNRTITVRDCGKNPTRVDKQLFIQMDNDVDLKKFITIDVSLSPSLEKMMITPGLYSKDDKPVCLICLDAPAVYYVSVCSHLILCELHVEDFRQLQNTCPLCRREDGQIFKAGLIDYNTIILIDELK